MKKIMMISLILLLSIIINVNAQMPSVDVMTNVNMFVSKAEFGSSADPVTISSQDFKEKTHLVVNDKIVIIDKNSYEVVAIALCSYCITGEYKIFYKSINNSSYSFNIDSFYYDPKYKKFVQTFEERECNTATFTDFTFSW